MATELREHFAGHKNDDEETKARNLKALQEQDAMLRVNLPKPGAPIVITRS